MVENLKIEKSLPSLSSTRRVKPMGHRQNDGQQNLYLKTFKERQKKKKSKEKSMHVKISDRAATKGKTLQNRLVATKQNSKALSSKGIIDIRV